MTQNNNNNLCRTEKIKNIEIIKENDYEHKYVYDFSVKDNETFSLSNGMIVHNTLNSFHYSGVASKSNVNSGVPRLSELLRITKNLKTPSMTIYLKPSIRSDKKKVLSFLNKIKNTYFNEFINETNIYYDNLFKEQNTIIKEDSKYIKSYFEFYSKINDMKFLNNLENWVLLFNISPIILYNKNITIYDINNILQEYFISKKLKVYIINNDENPTRIFIQIRFFKNQNIDFNTIFKLELDIMNNLTFNGIKNIDMAYIREVNINVINKKTESIDKKKEFVIDTNGTDLSKLFEYDEVDKNRSISNDPIEINKIFGIEMAREVIKREILNVMNSSGIYLNKHHVNLLCDYMTNKGVFKALNRHGINKSDSGPLLKASYEEMDKHLQRSSIFSQKDIMKSFSSNVMFTQRGRYGSGFCDIIYDDKTK